ncbi:MAG: putative protein YyaP [Fimbriimonadaceae bacterium]|nr:putative protein YyaP [Fimbriimonadaceae bacterium]
MSVDGFIANAEGGMKWLEPYHTPEIDWAAFMSRFGAVIVGRRTFDEAVANGMPLGQGMPTVVVTHRPLETPGVITASDRFDAVKEDLVRRLAGTGKDIWHMGGGNSVASFAALGLVDLWELSVIPVLLGSGIPMFAGEIRTHRLRLLESKRYSNGIVGLTYEPDR